MAKSSKKKSAQPAVLASPESPPPPVDYRQPASVSDIDVAFPARVIGRLLPPRSELPAQVPAYWVGVAEQWFSGSLAGRFVVKDGIDVTAAKRHLSACLRSFEPKHEDKIDGVAHLMSLWFERFEPGPRSSQA